MSSKPNQPAVIGPVEAIKQQLIALAPQFKAALPSNVTVERFVQVTMTAISQNQKMVEALGQSAYSRRTFYAAAAKCAQDGLIPDGREAAFVSFKNKDEGAEQITYFPMVHGILKKVRNSGELVDITAEVVYEGDEFDYQLGEKANIYHRPNWRGDRGKPIAAYAIARTKDGGIYREVMTEAQIQAVRNVSRSKDSGPWAGPFADEMRRKSVVRRLSKYLPMSSDISGVIHADDELFDFAAPTHEEPQPSAPAAQAQQQPKGASRTRAAVLGKDERPEPPAIEGSSENVTEAQPAAAAQQPRRTEPPKFEESDIV